MLTYLWRISHSSLFMFFVHKGNHTQIIGLVSLNFKLQSLCSFHSLVGAVCSSCPKETLKSMVSENMHISFKNHNSVPFVGEYKTVWSPRPTIFHVAKSCKISDFCHGTVEVFGHLECYVAFIGRSVPPSRVKQSKKNGLLSWNTGKQLHTNPV